MKIAIFTETFLPIRNGVVTTIVNLAKGLANRGHKIYIITHKYNKLNFSYPNVKVKFVKGVKSSFIYEDVKTAYPISIKTLNYIRKEKIDIIHFHSPWTVGLKAIFIAKLLDLPLVGTYHTLIGDPQNLNHIKLNNKFVRNNVWKYSNLYYNRCDIVTTPSEVIKKLLIKNGCKRKIKVIPNSIEIIKPDEKSASAIRKRYAPNGPLLIHFGRIAYEKNINYLLECFSLIIKKIPTAKLIVLGFGPQIEDLKRKAIELNLENNFSYLGGYETEKLMKDGYCKASDVFLTTSKTETGCIVVLEALSQGLPCVGVNKYALPFLIKNNHTGFIVPSNDKKAFAKAVIKILKNKKLKDKFSKNAIEFAKDFETNVIVDKWEELFLSLIKKKNIKTKNILKKLIKI
ncbi:MAG: glycosyltransferase [archaeon]